MNWYEWKREWEKKHYEWHSNEEKYKRGEKFRDNLIGVYEFSDPLGSTNAYFEVEDIYRNSNPPKPPDFCWGLDGSQFRIHFLCPDLPLIVKVCEAFGGYLDGWDTSKIEEPPDGGEIYVPKKKR